MIPMDGVEFVAVNRKRGKHDLNRKLDLEGNSIYPVMGIRVFRYRWECVFSSLQINVIHIIKGWLKVTWAIV